MTYVVLAAGSSTRMGFDKVFAPLGSGGAPLERVATLLRERCAILVVPRERVEEARRMAPGMRVVVNGEPQRGMAHSLRLALEALDDGEDFGVLLGDKPFLTRATLDALERALRDHDVVYPVSEGGIPGHPVLFAATVREKALQLPDGDTIFTLRDEPALRSARVLIDDAGAFSDLDTPAHWEAARNA